MKGMWQSHCHSEYSSPSSIVLSCEPSCYTPSVKLNSSLTSCYFISCYSSWTYQQHNFAVKITNLFKCLNKDLNILLQLVVHWALNQIPWILCNNLRTTYASDLKQHLILYLFKILQPWTRFVPLLLWTWPAIQSSLLDRLSTQPWFTLHVVNRNSYHIILLESIANPWSHSCSISLKQSLT